MYLFILHKNHFPVQYLFAEVSSVLTALTHLTVQSKAELYSLGLVLVAFLADTLWRRSCPFLVDIRYTLRSQLKSIGLGSVLLRTTL